MLAGLLRTAACHRAVRLARGVVAWNFAIAVCLIACGRTAAADHTFVVTTPADSGGAGSLRGAILQANAAGAGTQTITFLGLSGTTITLVSALPVLNNASGQIVINGPGAANLTIDGNDTNRVFFVQSGNVTISQLNVVNARASGGNGGADPLAGGGGGLGAGGGLFVNQGANVTIQNVTFNNNGAAGGSGGTLTGGGVAGGGGGGGVGGNGGEGGAQGGGGGGGFNTNGGNGGIFGGAGGGGLVGDGQNGGTFTAGAGSSPGGNGGDPGNSGADGGVFGGGGGGGSQANGGNGGDFAGGGGAGTDAPLGGGNGGFGGGGGGAVNSAGGTGGFGAGDGGTANAGNGGSGFGGALFVRQGGTLTILDSSTSGNSVAAGAGGGGSAVTGQAAGEDLYLMTGVNATFGGTSSMFTGSISGAGSVTIQSSGTTTFAGANNYSGGTTVTSGTLLGDSVSLQGDITNNAGVEFDQAINGVYAGNMSGSGQLTKTGNGNLTLSGLNSYAGGTTISAGKLIGNTGSLQGNITDNAQLVFDQSTDGSYSGLVTGTGSLVKSGTGNLTLVGNNPFSGLGNNSYSGGTTIQAGTLTGSTSSLQGNIVNNGYLVFDQNSFANSFSGNISGSGGVTVTDGVVEFLGTNSYTGGTTISGASLVGNSDSLQGDIQIDSNSSLNFAQFSDGAYVGDLTGSGTLYKTGTGSVTLTGNNSFSGQTYVQEGRLAVNGTLDGFVQVAGGVFGGNATINGNLQNIGTIAPGNSIGTITVNGNYSSGAGATQEVEINSAGNTPGVNNDRMIVNGTATIGGSAVVVQAAPGNYASGTKYTFLEATTLTGVYGNVTVFNVPNLFAVLGYEDIMVGGVPYETAYILLNSQSDFGSIANTFNQRGVANYIDDNSINPTADMHSLIDTFNTLSVPEQQAALESMEAEVNGTLAQLQVQNTAFLYSMLRRRVGSGFIGGGLINDGDEGDDESVALDGGRGAASIVPASYDSTGGMQSPVRYASQSASCSPWSGWSAGYGLGGNAQSDGNAAGGTYDGGGTIMAIERPLDGRSLAGFFGGYSDMGVHLNGLSQSASASQGLFGGYLIHDLGRTYSLVAGSAGFTDYRESRHMNFGNVNSTANGDYDGWSPSAYLEQGLRLPVGQGVLQPYGALQYVYVRQDSFTETGAGTLNQAADGIDTHALRGILGSRLSRAWRTENGRLLIPELRAAWMHEFLEPTTILNATFAPIGGGSFATKGLDFGRDWSLLGGGVQLILSQNASLFANYDLQLNAVQTWHAGSGGIQLTW